MAGYTLGQMFRFKPSKRDQQRVVRDRLVREGHHVRYKVWGNTIASLNRKDKTLYVSDAGWQTKLTKDRLNQIMPNETKISQKRHQWNVHLPSGKSVAWKGSWRFNLRKLGY